MNNEQLSEALRSNQFENLNDVLSLVKEMIKNAIGKNYSRLL